MGLIDNINKLFDHRIRLGMMSIQIEKSFIGKKPNTKYSITKEGKLAFQKHIEALENLIRQQT